jgi:hypothetical protein
MPKRHIPSADTDYYLMIVDRNGVERSESDGTKTSQTIVQLAADGVTDIFIASHGWKGDIPAAISQYDRWIAAMAAQSADRAHARALVPAFKSLAVGIHWPSLPWGDEQMQSALLSDTEDVLASERTMDVDQLVDRYADRICDSPASRAALATIVACADHPESGAEDADAGVGPELQKAYSVLFEEAGLGADGVSGAPGRDQDDFSASTTAREWVAALGGPSSEPGGEGPGLLGGGVVADLRDKLLGPVRQMSFWTMKRRAATVGQRDVHRLLRELQVVAPTARIHLMGHSFGCIVVTAATVGPISDGQPEQRLARPIDSLFLVQGAMSLWSFADTIPFPPREPGYFQSMCGQPRLVRGPIVTTRSVHDHAVGTFFPLGAKVAHERTLDAGELPEYGGVGAFGLHGIAGAVDTPILAPDASYGFEPSSVYNIDASRVVSEGAWPSGAHSDIIHPEVAHIFWQAALCTAM